MLFQGYLMAFEGYVDAALRCWTGAVSGCVRIHRGQLCLEFREEVEIGSGDGNTRHFLEVRVRGRW